MEKRSSLGATSFRRDSVSMEAIRSLLGKAVRFVRRLPAAYLFGILALVAGAALLATSLLSYVAVVDLVAVTGEAPPGMAERDVPLNLTSFFRATLTVQSCGVAFHLLTDPEYDAFLAYGRLPPPTLDCTQAEAVIRSRVGHMVTVYRAPSNASNVPYTITAALFAERHPYALLSVPGAILAMAATVWIAIRVMNRGTEKLVAESRERQRQRKAK